ncbi:MAG: hypothetical protein DWQ36_20305 [Acidobacteria bacterium]|nr:MAG: hypothetical protein DWQ30_20730 [Acidobacteriota bacterium]REK03212.1 MAG: hypothetical protein DWQ36_20305 [Acidobacteriota bacterium]
MDGKRLLVYLLRFDATVLTLAFAAIFLPRDFMAWSNQALGLEALPATPLSDYLTRSLAAMYGVRGLFVWLASRDVDRFRPFVVLIGATNVLLGVLLLGIDLYAGLPLLWTLGEGPGIVVVGLLVLWMTSRFVPRRED